MQNSDVKSGQSDPGGLIFRGTRVDFGLRFSTPSDLPPHTVVWVLDKNSNRLISQWINLGDDLSASTKILDELSGLLDDVTIEVSLLGPWRVGLRQYGKSLIFEVRVNSATLVHISYGEAIGQLQRQLRQIKQQIQFGLYGSERRIKTPLINQRALGRVKTMGIFDIGQYLFKLVGIGGSRRHRDDGTATNSWPASADLRLGSKSRYLDSAIDGFVWVDGNEFQGRTIRDALFQVAREYETITFELGKDFHGSWFQTFRIRVAAAFGSEEGKRLTEQVKLRLEHELVNRAQAEVDQIKSTSVASLLNACAEVDNAVIILGQLILLKSDGLVAVRSIDPQTAAKIEATPALFSQPSAVLAMIDKIHADAKQLEG